LKLVGPGCSSLGYGAFEELGPFRINSDGKTLYRNKYAWNEGKTIINIIKFLLFDEFLRHEYLIIIKICSGKCALLGISSRSRIFLLKHHF
jgi:hypothetical protein